MLTTYIYAFSSIAHTNQSGNAGGISATDIFANYYGPFLRDIGAPEVFCPFLRCAPASSCCVASPSGCFSSSVSCRMLLASSNIWTATRVCPFSRHAQASECCVASLSGCFLSSVSCSNSCMASCVCPFLRYALLSNVASDEDMKLIDSALGN